MGQNIPDSTLDCTDGAVFELNDHHADVFSFQVIVELLTRRAVDLFYLVPHHPAQQVNAVNALVHEAASVACPDNLLRICHVHCHGLFDDDIHTRINTIKCDLCVDTTLGSNRNEL